SRLRFPRFTRAFSLAAHVWLGLLSTLLILDHSGPRTIYDRPGFRLAYVLLCVFLLTNGLGLLGIVLQAWLPWLIRRTILEGRLGRVAEIPVGQIKYVLDRWRDEANRLIGEIEAAGVPQIRTDYEKRIHRVLEELPVLSPLRVLVWRGVNRSLD